MKFTIKINGKKTFYCYDVAHIPLKDFLTKNKFESEIVYFINELVDFEVGCTLDEGGYHLTHHIENQNKTIITR